MLYTGKGDNGMTKTFGCDQKVSKSSVIAEALGTLDEVNSFLGIIKVRCDNIPKPFVVHDKRFGDIVEGIQQNLFSIQAELAGADKKISEEKLRECELFVNEAEKILPPIKSFFISGGTELSSSFDYARTLARRAERRVVAVVEEGGVSLGEWTLPYLNRLSSLLYVLARLSNHYSKKQESTPTYI